LTTICRIDDRRIVLVDPNASGQDVPWPLRALPAPRGRQPDVDGAGGIGYDLSMKRRPNGKNVEVALQLLQLSLVLKSAVRKAARKR
jgi:hypothetical protein